VTNRATITMSVRRPVGVRVPGMLPLALQAFVRNHIGSGYSCVQEGRTLDRILPQIKESGPRNCGEDR
jgi:hypothetical protein